MAEGRARQEDLERADTMACQRSCCSEAGAVFGGSRTSAHVTHPVRSLLSCVRPQACAEPGMSEIDLRLHRHALGDPHAVAGVVYDVDGGFHHRVIDPMDLLAAARNASGSSARVLQRSQSLPHVMEFAQRRFELVRTRAIFAIVLPMTLAAAAPVHCQQSAEHDEGDESRNDDFKGLHAEDRALFEVGSVSFGVGMVAAREDQIGQNRSSSQSAFGMHFPRSCSTCSHGWVSANGVTPVSPNARSNSASSCANRRWRPDPGSAPCQSRRSRRYFDSKARPSKATARDLSCTSSKACHASPLQ